MSKNINIQMKQFNGVDYDNIYPVGENKIGDIVFLTREEDILQIGDKYLSCNGGIYDASKYPELAKILGSYNVGLTWKKTKTDYYTLISPYKANNGCIYCIGDTAFDGGVNGIFESKDNGKTFNPKFTNIQDSTGTGDAFMEFGNTMLFTGYNAIYKTTNNWASATKVFSKDYIFSAGKGFNNRIFIYLTDGTIQYSDDFGSSWKQSYQAYTRPYDAYIYNFDTNGIDAIYCCGTRFKRGSNRGGEIEHFILKSANNGENWEEITVYPRTEVGGGIPPESTFYSILYKEGFVYFYADYTLFLFNEKTKEVKRFNLDSRGARMLLDGKIYSTNGNPAYILGLWSGDRNSERVIKLDDGSLLKFEKESEIAYINKSKPTQTEFFQVPRIQTQDSFNQQFLCIVAKN